MRYRKQDDNGDFVFGKGSADFLVNTPEAVAQLVKTRLALLVGEWFLDTTDGMPWATQVLGAGTMATYNAAIRSRILDTQGVTAIAAYSSNLDPNTRTLSVTVTLDTIYGVTQPTQVL